jgi:hypothetical protein
MAGDIYFVPLSPQAMALREQIHALTGKFDMVLQGMPNLEAHARKYPEQRASDDVIRHQNRYLRASIGG